MSNDQPPLQHSEEAAFRLEAIINGAVFAIITIDEAGIIEDFNPSAEQMFGYSASEAIGRNISMLMPDPYRTAHDGYLRDYLAGGERKIIGLGREVVGLRRDGKTFPVDLTVSEVTLADRRLFTGMIEDISARKEAELQVKELQNELIHVARLSAMGELASALAHELNQPLTAISNYAQAARRLLDGQREQDRARSVDLLLKASDQALRAGEIIRRLRQFIEWGETERSWHDIRKAVEEAAHLGMVGAGSHGIAFEIEAADQLPKVMMDRIQIQQVIQNIVRNAVDAMVDWGGARNILVRVASQQADQVEILVEDTGPGLALEVKKRLFEPFVTTKPNGMGIGLSVCRNIVESHGGSITVPDRPSGGTTFRVVLPVSDS